MRNYDVPLKNLLQRALAGSVLSAWTGITVTRWHNAELPIVSSRRVDLLGEDAEGNLAHIELQSRNDPEMPLRMAEYALAIHRKFGRFPRQLVLYVGQKPLTMSSSLEAPNVFFRCRIADIRELDAEILLASDRLEDNLAAILAGGMDEREVTRHILQKIEESEPAERSRALSELALLSGLRPSVGIILEEEITRMPILYDIMDNKFIGPKVRRAHEEGRAEGKVDGERELLLRLLSKRFERIPDWAQKRIEALSKTEIEETALRAFTASSLEELFR